MTQTHIDEYNDDREREIARKLAIVAQAPEVDFPSRIRAATELGQLARMQLTWPTLDHAHWNRLLAIAESVTPVQNTPSPVRIEGLLSENERAELRPKAAGVSKAEATQALGLLELSEASETGADFGLTEAETAAARLLRDDQRHTAALAEVGREIREQGQRLAAMNPAAPNPEPATGSIHIENL